MPTAPIVAVSLKMYFDRERTLSYCEAVAALAGSHAVADGDVTLAVLPDHLTLEAAARVLSSTRVILGAQDLCPQDRGAYTGEVSGRDISALGCRCVEVGHAERRRIFREDDAMVAAKTAAAVRNGLIPLLCIGEADRTTPAAAAETCAMQVRSALDGRRVDGEVWLAYEPTWAIGAAEPAPAGYVRDVCDILRQQVTDLVPRCSLLYGGSAGPGLLPTLWPSVDGLFLGRFAHDPAALHRVLDEASGLREPPLT